MPGRKKKAGPLPTVGKLRLQYEEAKRNDGRLSFFRGLSEDLYASFAETTRMDVYSRFLHEVFMDMSLAESVALLVDTSANFHYLKPHEQKCTSLFVRDFRLHDGAVIAIKTLRKDNPMRPGALWSAATTEDLQCAVLVGICSKPYKYRDEAFELLKREARSLTDRHLWVIEQCYELTFDLGLGVNARLSYAIGLKFIRNPSECIAFIGVQCGVDPTTVPGANPDVVRVANVYKSAFAAEEERASKRSRIV